MTLLIDLAFLLAAAGSGAAVVGLIVWLRTMPGNDATDDREGRFASDTLSRLQELTQRVAAEVDQHAECVEEIQAQLISTDAKDEAAVVAAVAQLLDANERMRRQLDTAEQRLQMQASQIESHSVAAHTDSLTQVANRRALDSELRRCLADFKQSGIVSTVMLLDVDHFKQFNDTHGHQAGDDALRAVARALRQSVSDVGFVARYGGEEFAVVFAGLDASAATAYCERARQAIAATALKVEGREVRITASSGVTQTIPDDTEEQLLGRADDSLYASKNMGRNCGHFHDGRTCRLLRYKPLSAAGPSDPGPALLKIGDEWLYEDDAHAETLFREPLANIASRPEFFDELIRRLASWRKDRTPLALALIQVDSHARIISDHGPTAAEVVLRIASQFVNAAMRDIDRVARLSEDTFALLLPGAVLQDGVSLTERLRQAVERCPLPRTAGTMRFTISAGVVQASRDDDLRGLLQRGRSALADAVNAGRNRVAGKPSLGSHVREPEVALS